MQEVNNLIKEYIIDNYLLKKRARRWKYLALSIIIVFMIVSFVKFLPTKTDYIGTIDIEGTLYEDKLREQVLSDLKDDDYLKALIVNINSGGGSVVGSEKIYNALKDIATKKPVIAVLGTMATSGAYLVALSADHIIAYNGTLTGSIGVIMQSPEVTELADKLGIKFNNFKSSELKASPNLFEKLTTKAKEAIMFSIDDASDYFINLVAVNRNLSSEQIKEITLGKIYTGRQALKLNLVDQIGTSKDAILWLKINKGVNIDLKIDEIKTSRKLTWPMRVLQDIFYYNLDSNYLSNKGFIAQ